MSWVQNLCEKLEIPLTLIPGYVLAALAGAGTFYIAITTAQSPEARAVQILLFLGGAAAGWTCGLLLSPTSEPQARQFQNLARTLTTFISGAIWGRLVVYLNDLASVQAALKPPVAVRLLIPTVSFLLGALCSYMPRAAEQRATMQKRDRDNAASGAKPAR